MDLAMVPFVPWLVVIVDGSQILVGVICLLQQHSTAVLQLVFRTDSMRCISK